MFSAEKPFVGEVGQSLLRDESFCFLILWKFPALILHPSTKRERTFLMKKHGECKDFLLLTVPLSVRDRLPPGAM